MKSSPKAREVVRKYYLGWVGKDFKAATALLSPALKVEVPVYQYPTKESFAAALWSFGSLAKRATLLAEFSTDDEAMLLYDMDVEGLGPFRVAEHFTVEDGLITRIRQVHDTFAIRKAGFVGE